MFQSLGISHKIRKHQLKNLKIKVDHSFRKKILVLQALRYKLLLKVMSKFKGKVEKCCYKSVKY